MQEIAANVYVSEVDPGINVGFIVTETGVVAVDAPPLPADAIAWREQILDAGYGPIRYVVLTDEHPDRLPGLHWLDAPVVAGRGALQRLKEDGEARWRTILEDWSRRRPEVQDLDRVRRVMPDIAVAGRILLHGTPPVAIESVAGAAPGSVWVTVHDEEVLFAGDTVVVGDHPPLIAAPDTRAWLKTLVGVRRERFPARLIIPGRGPVGEKEDTRGLSHYIQLARRRIRSLHTAGAGRGEVAGLVPEFLDLYPVAEKRREWVERQIQQGLEHVYEELRPEESEE